MTERGEGIRALQIVDTLGMGGAETWLMEVLRRWSQSGVAHIDFLITSSRQGFFDEEARSLGANLFYVRYGLSYIPQFIKDFRKILAKGRYDAIHDHQDYVSGWHFLMGTGLLPRVRVTHIHNPAYQINSNYGVTVRRRVAANIGKRLIAAMATHIAATSTQVIGEYGFEQRRFAHLPKFALHCGFDPGRFLGDRERVRREVLTELNWPQDTKLILFAGRIDESARPTHARTHKNSGFATDVAIASAHLDSRIRTLFAGQRQPVVKALEDRAAAAGVGSHVLFAGVRPDIDRLMLAADVLSFPSRGEGLGMVAVEAQAAGLPVLAASTVPRECVVLRDLVRFKSIEDGPEAWAKEMKELIRLPRDVEAANRAVANSPFSIDHSASSLFALYSGIDGTD